MKIFLIVLLGMIGGYLITVGAFNDWTFIALIEPKEAVKRLFTFSFMACVCSFFAWFILVVLFEWWD